MGRPRTYLYRLLKASWGIWIEITSQASIRESVESEQVHSSLPVWIAFEGAVAELPELYRKELSKGLFAVAADISEKVGGQPITVTVLKISFVECDFQLEGLSVAMCRWAEEEFGFARRDIAESFDRSANRYVFDWR